MRRLLSSKSPLVAGAIPFLIWVAGAHILVGYVLAPLVVRMICLGFGLNDWLSTAAVAMAGYGGGKTLDLLVEAISKRAVR